jgi:antirestriction protein
MIVVQDMKQLLERFDGMTGLLAVDAEDIPEIVEGYPFEAFRAWVEDVAEILVANHSDALDAFPAFRDSYEGEMSAEDFAWDVAEDSMPADSLGLRYFDAEGFARDMKLSGEFVEVGPYLFRTSW